MLNDLKCFAVAYSEQGHSLLYTVLEDQEHLRCSLDALESTSNNFRRRRNRIKRVVKKLDTALTRMIVYMFLTIGMSAGCSNFEHPLPWEQSPLHDKLQGSWHASEGSEEPPMKVDVTLLENDMLSFKLEVDPNPETPSSDVSNESSSRTQFVYFNAEVLASNDVHVLQIDMDSYEERSREDVEPKFNYSEGYWFVRVLPENGSVVFRQIDVQGLARYAEAQLVDEGTSLTSREFADCVDEKIKVEMFSKLLSELLSERPIDLLSEEERVEMEKALQEYEYREVKPYRELQRMRECVAYKLPGEALGRLIVQNPEDSFETETLRMSRVD